MRSQHFNHLLAKYISLETPDLHNIALRSQDEGMWRFDGGSWAALHRSIFQQILHHFALLVGSSKVPKYTYIVDNQLLAQPCSIQGGKNVEV